MSRLNRSLDQLASRGEPKGALDVFAAAITETEVMTPVAPKSSRNWAVVAGSFAAVLVIGGLLAALLPGSPFNLLGTDEPNVVTVDGATLLVSGPSDVALFAQISGELVVGDGGCLAVSRDGYTFPLVFPMGSRFVAGTALPTVSVPGGGDIAVGQLVSGGGGYLTLPSIDDRLPDIPAECAGFGDEVAIANNSNGLRVASFHSRVIRVIGVRPATPASQGTILVLDTGDELRIPRLLDLPESCVQQQGPDSETVCQGVVGLGEDGVTVTAFLTAAGFPWAPQTPGRMAILSDTIGYADNSLVLDYGITLEFAYEVGHGDCGLIGLLPGEVPPSEQWVITLDEEGRAANVQCIHVTR